MLSLSDEARSDVLIDPSGERPEAGYLLGRAAARWAYPTHQARTRAEHQVMSGLWIRCFLRPPRPERRSVLGSSRNPPSSRLVICSPGGGQETTDRVQFADELSEEAGRAGIAGVRQVDDGEAGSQADERAGEKNPRSS